MDVRSIVELNDQERKALGELTRSGNPPARAAIRARMLLMADAGALDRDIIAALGTSTSTVYRLRRRFVEAGVDGAMTDRPREGGRRKLTGKEEATLVATACSEPPEGSARWTLELLAGEIARLTGHESVSRETVLRRLADNELKPWRRKMWCISKIDAEYIARMESVLDLYAQPVDPDDPVVSFDESPKQLIGEARVPVPAAPGRPRRVDYEYRRIGHVNLFVGVGVGFSWRHVKVTDRPSKLDFAECMRVLVDTHFPKAKRIRVVMDNLNTHRRSTLYETFRPVEARRILRRLELHFSPKHVSWLNMVEIEIGALSSQCLNRRVGERHVLEREIAAWQRKRNASGAKIKWMFSLDQARTKLTKIYGDATEPLTAIAA